MMTKAERALLLMCGASLIRGHSLDEHEIQEVEDLLDEVMPDDDDEKSKRKAK